MAVPLFSNAGDSLLELGNAFKSFRESAGKCFVKYPLSLQRSAIEMHEKGISMRKIARASGVGLSTLYEWQSLRPTWPRRLAIISESDSAKFPAPAAQRDNALPCSTVESNRPSGEPLPVAPLFRFQLAGGVICEASAEQALWLVRSLGGGAPC
jgi:hypothetical protein